MSEDAEARFIAEKLTGTMRLLSGFISIHGPPPVRISMIFRDSGIDASRADDTREEFSKKIVDTLNEGEFVVFLAESWLQENPENLKRPSLMTEEERKAAGVITAVIAEVWPHRGRRPFFLLAKEAENYSRFYLMEGNTIVYHSTPEAEPDPETEPDPDDAA